MGARRLSCRGCDRVADAFAGRMKRPVAFAVLAGILALVLPAHARAQGLVVPLTGKRVHDVQPSRFFHTLFTDFFPEDDATTYVQTGDIPAMWLRDSSAQTIPYVRFQTGFPILRGRFAGVIQRNARNIVTDPYANAFQANYHVWERKWEVDSLAWPMVLTWVYWRLTARQDDLYAGTARRDADDRCDILVRGTAPAMQSLYLSVSREDRRRVRCGNGNDLGGVPAVRRSGAVSLQRSAECASRRGAPRNQALALQGYGDGELAACGGCVSDRVQSGIQASAASTTSAVTHGCTPTKPTDSVATISWTTPTFPNLTTLPYIDWCSAFDPTYLDTRAFALSSDNPLFFSGRYAAGLGSPHTPPNYVWPLGIIGRALTATSSSEVAEAMTTLAETDGEVGMIHESFYDDGYWRLHARRVRLGQRAGSRALLSQSRRLRVDAVHPDGAVLPFERRTPTPTLVPANTRKCKNRKRTRAPTRAVTSGRAGMRGAHRQRRPRHESGYYRHPYDRRRSDRFRLRGRSVERPSRGGVADRLTVSFGMCSFPRLSPDGSASRSSTDEGKPEVYVMPAAGGEAAPLTYLGAAQAAVCVVRRRKRNFLRRQSDDVGRTDTRPFAVDARGGT